MNDYSCYSIKEATDREIVIKFVTAIKQMDADFAIARLIALVTFDKSDAEFYSIVSRFINVIGHKTCVDPS